MRGLSILQIAVAITLPVIVAFGCKKDDQSGGATSPSASTYATGYPTGQPTGYPTGQPTGYPTATGPVPTATGSAAMAVPGPLALPCSAGCGLAKCNMQYQKCAFPCANSDADCIQGAMCNAMTGLCLPKGPGQ
jgi:hypothetical protein